MAIIPSSASPETLYLGPEPGYPGSGDRRSLSDEFNDSSSYSLSEFYSGGSLVPASNSGVPSSGTISLGDFYGATNITPLVIPSGGTLLPTSTSGSPGTHLYRVFISPGTLNVASGGPGPVTILVIGGGGSAGGNRALFQKFSTGGGGGGGVRYIENHTLGPGQYPIVVGSGGHGHSGVDFPPPQYPGAGPGTNGQDSSGFGFSATGGGHGGTMLPNGTSPQTPQGTPPPYYGVFPAQNNSPSHSISPSTYQSLSGGVRPIVYAQPGGSGGGGSNMAPPHSGFNPAPFPAGSFGPTEWIGAGNDGNYTPAEGNPGGRGGARGPTCPQQTAGGGGGGGGGAGGHSTGPGPNPTGVPNSGVGGGEGGAGRACPHFPGPVIANALPANYDRYPRGGTLPIQYPAPFPQMRINRRQEPIPVAGPPYSQRRGPAYALNADNPSESNVRTLKQSFIDAVGPTGLYGGGGGGSRGPHPWTSQYKQIGTGEPGPGGGGRGSYESPPSHPYHELAFPGVTYTGGGGGGGAPYNFLPGPTAGPAWLPQTGASAPYTHGNWTAPFAAGIGQGAPGIVIIRYDAP